MKNFKGVAIVDLAAAVFSHLEKHDVQVVLVGGLAVEIYTDNRYLTKDIDFVNTNYRAESNLSEAMAEIGFFKQGRVYVNDTTDISIEFPPGPLAVGNELVKPTEKRVAGQIINILTAEDVVKDRLAAFVHWNDRSSLVQATSISLKHGFAPSDFKPFFENEGNAAAFQLFDKLYKRALSQELDSMLKIEAALTKLLLQEL